MREKNEMMEVSVYMAKIYAITKPEQANRIIEKAKEESKTLGVPYKDVLSNEFMKLLDSSETENKTNIMEINFNGNKDDISAIMLSSERYALGRMTYIVQWTCEIISKNTHLITTKDLKVMIRDIEDAEFYGADFDKKEWLRLLEILKLELKRRDE